jgi:two-component system OmpR family response regulator
MSQTATILIADDDPHIREMLGIALSRAGYDTLTASQGAAALELALNSPPDLIVLDIGLPEMDGLEVCRRLRASSDLPVLFLTARDDELDRVLGLEMGADDYVTKPFSPRELVARVKAILKRSQRFAPPPSDRQLTHGDLSLAPDSHDCRVAGQSVTLTNTEMTLLNHLMQHPEQVISRAQLLDVLYGTNIHVSERTLDSHLRNLRAKLAKAGCQDAIQTLHGVGIRMGTCTAA